MAIMAPSGGPLKRLVCRGNAAGSGVRALLGAAIGSRGLLPSETSTATTGGTDVEPIALRSPALGEVAFEDHLEAPLAVALDGAGLLRESEATGELAEQREQRQVGPCGRLEPMRLRLRDRDRPAGDSRPQDCLELAERDLPLGDPAQVVLIEVEALHQRSENLPRRWSQGRYAPSASAALS